MNELEYSLFQFGRMMNDKVRMSAYQAAISRAVRPGDAVLDLGCGPGIMAMLACRAGAGRVYAIDTNSVVDFGRQLGVANGLLDKIQFLHGDSRRIELPERVDVIVSDVRGKLPLYAEAIQTLNDARARFLAEGGRMIPISDILFTAVVEAGEQYRALTEPWSLNGLNLSEALSLVVNTIYGAAATQQLISSPQKWCVLDYSCVVNPRAAGCIQIPIVRDSTAHGLTMWFETVLFDDIGYSSGPDNGESVYGRLFFPWESPVALFAGDEVRVDLRADPVGGDYVWRWETRIPAREGRTEIVFRQSTFQGATLSPSLLHKHSANFVPELSTEGQAERWLLQSMDGKRSLEDIASEAVRLFPGIFRRREDALSRAADLAEEFSL
jgi:type I protein arginine methyltransferase